MRVLIATGLYPPEIGGPATYAKLLVEKLPPHGIEVDVLPFSSVRTWPKVMRHLAYAVAVFKRARTADLIFVQDTVSTGLPVYIASKLALRPYILRAPGDYAWEQGVQRFGVSDSIDEFQKKHYGVRVTLLRKVQHAVARGAACVIAPSHYFGRIVRGWGVSASRLRVIYNSVEIEEAAAPENPPQKPFVVSVGRLVPWKGFDTLIRVLKELPEWRLVIVGDGPDRERLQNLSREIGVEGRVLFTGARPRAEVFGWYRAADVFVLNSSFESFSFQVAEALACGIPIIATNIGSVPELVESGKEGLLVGPNDQSALEAAITSVVAEKERWAERTSAGKKKALRFSPDGIVGELVSLFKTYE